MTASLALYSVVMRAAEPFIPRILAGRVKRGKEDRARIGERLGFTHARRPDGLLIWMHAASVGESRLLIDLYAALRSRRPDISAVITTQTLTSANLIAATGVPHLIHQMAPVDTPGPVTRFLDHWRPDAAIFAEGEIWPHMLLALRRRGINAALVNARMTARTLKGWRQRSGAARKVFGAFTFIGSADAATAGELSSILSRSINVVGNLKRAADIEPPSASEVEAWRRAAGGRPVLLAASTHPGEDEIALNAFTEVRARAPSALLIIAPRHPDRGSAIADQSRARGFTTLLRSQDRATPNSEHDVLVADTMGEMLFWYAASDAIYLGGAHAVGVGGHNAIEPAALGKRVFTGPEGFNFSDTFEKLREMEMLVIGPAGRLSDFWLSELNTDTAQTASLNAFFADARAPFEATLDAVTALLPTGESQDA